MKVIMLLSNPFKPDPRVYKEAKTLVKYGHEVTVLAWDRECRLPKTEVINGIKVRRIRQKAPYGKFLSLVPLMFMFWFRCLAFLLKEKFSIVHCHDFDTVIPGLIAAKIKKRWVIYDVHDYYPSMVVKNVPNFIIGALEGLERIALNHADHVITVNEKLGGFLLRRSTTKVTYVMNCVDLVEYKPATKRLSGHLKILYIGALTKNRGIEHMIEVISGLNNVTLTIAGYGAEKEFLIKKIPRDCKNIKFIGEVHPPKVPNLMTGYDITFALYDPLIPNNRFASPNKLFEAMAGEMPIIVSDGTVMGEIVRKEKCGLIVKYGDLDRLRDAVMELQRNVDLRRELGENGLKAAKREYNWELMRERLTSLYEGLEVAR